MPLRASHALSYKQTLAALLKFPITSFMPQLGRHLLLIEDRLTSCARGLNASPTSVSLARSHTNRVPTTWHALSVQDVEGPVAKGLRHAVAPKRPLPDRKLKRAKLEIFTKTVSHGFQLGLRALFRAAAPADCRAWKVSSIKKSGSSRRLEPLFFAFTGKDATHHGQGRHSPSSPIYFPDARS